MKPFISKSILFLFLLCISFLSYGQKQSNNKKAQSFYDQAQKQLVLQNMENSIRLLKSAIAEDHTFATAQQQLADIYRRQEKYTLAIPLYQAVLLHDASLTPLTRFGLGESLLFEGHYAEAKENLLEYARNNLSEKSKITVNKYLSDCSFALAYQSTTANFPVLTKLSASINSPNDEYFPKLTADNNTIIFTRKLHNKESFYESTRHKDKWTEATKLLGDINSEDFNEGAHCISPDGKYLFFTGCNRPNGLGSCDIYVAKKENGKWSKPHNLGAPINTRGWEAQPAISADGKTLYFVSNRSSGYGGNDIWKSELGTNGQWQPPVNLGPKINTSFDEGAPYIHADNQTLYFASDGWPGFGRSDIFTSTIDNNGNWTTPVNLGKPANNHYNQMSLHVSMNGELAFLATKDSSDQLDIYSYSLPKEFQPTPVAYIAGTVLDADSKKPLGATISVTNTKDEKVVFQDLADYQDGKFIATLPLGSNYAVHVQHQNYMFDSEQYDLNDHQLSNKEFTTEILLQPIRAGNTTQLNNIYFDIDKYDLLPASNPDLKLLLNFLKSNQRVNIEVSGHTDNTGNKHHNQKLSENRAKAVTSFLLDHGIASERLKSVGYGDLQPIAPNDKEENRRLNRRTEIKILN